MFCLSKKKNFCLFSPLFPDISSAFVICLNMNSFYLLVFLRCSSQKSSAWAEDRKSLPRSSAHGCFCASAHLRWNESVFGSTLTLRFPPLFFFLNIFDVRRKQLFVVEQRGRRTDKTHFTVVLCSHSNSFSVLNIFSESVGLKVLSRPGQCSWAELNWATGLLLLWIIGYFTLLVQFM